MVDKPVENVQRDELDENRSRARIALWIAEFACKFNLREVLNGIAEQAASIVEVMVWLLWRSVGAIDAASGSVSLSAADPTAYASHERLCPFLRLL
jgi:hypothetical protein